MTPSRPLRALWVAVGAYTVLRSAALWIGEPLPIAADRKTTSSSAKAKLDSGARSVLNASVLQPDFSDPTDFMVMSPTQPLVRAVDPAPIMLAPDDATTPAVPGKAIFAQSRVPFLLPLPTPAGEPSDASRWSASAWLLVRGAGAASLANAGQLGGSQIGMRGWYRLNPSVSLTARISAPLEAAGREAAVGIALRRGAIGIIVEKRIKLDAAARDDIGVIAFGGIDAALPHDFRLDGYAQAGVVGRDAFADGALRVERTLIERSGLRVSVGAGAWGAAQPGVARFDMGPTIVARIPLGDTALRVSAEWRARVAGNARPGSGPTLTIGTDF